MRKKLHTLAAYSLAAGAYLCIPGQADGQAVYTDIEPDTLLEDDFDYAVFDLNHDGIDDFTFLLWSYSTSTGTFSSSFHIDKIFAGPRYDGGVNAVAGTSHYVFSVGLYVLPYAFSLGESINNALQFNNQGFQRMAVHFSTLKYGGDWGGGFWYPSRTDHYLGVRFLDTLDCLHYGWIRCDVLDSAKVIIVKDFAYELKCDTPIKAGDMVGDTTVSIHTSQDNEASIYAFNNTIYIHLPQLPEPNTQVVIYDMLGREIYQQDLETTSTQLQLNTAAGIYLVTIQDKEGWYSKKVLVE